MGRSPQHVCAEVGTDSLVFVETASTSHRASTLGTCTLQRSGTAKSRGAKHEQHTKGQAKNRCTRILKSAQQNKSGAKPSTGWGSVHMQDGPSMAVTNIRGK